ATSLILPHGAQPVTWQLALPRHWDTDRFTVTALPGTPTEQLGAVLHRYFDFVGEHAAGYAALLRGGSVVETARTSAIVDDVRRAAIRRTLRHLGVRRAGPRLTLLVRSWISVVEASAISWLDEGRQIPAESLCEWLVDQFVVMAAATALRDEQTGEALAHWMALETADSPAGVLARKLFGRETGESATGGAGNCAKGNASRPQDRDAGQ
ncbi:hypothetical protein ACWEMJ_25460, partial [Kitasatospora sp. NPDC004531]